VLAVQKILNEDRKATGSDPIAEDGVFGPETLKALRAFQHTHSLEQTGVVDEETWKQLDAPDAPATPADPTPPAPPASSTSSADRPELGAAEVLDNALVPGGSAGGSPSTASTDSKKIWHAPMHLSAKALDELARIVEAEAGVCSDEGKVAVAAVVLNRVRGGWANGTIHGVVSEPAQFDGYGSRTFRSKPSQASIDAAKRAAAGEDLSLGATYYFNPYLVHPSWAKTMKLLVRIGTDAENTHVFYKP
jgi:N-acetylmuramoyl-L-alanine amidase